MRFVLMILLAMATGGAAAEWVAFGSSGVSNDRFDIYVDPVSIRRSGDTVQMWDMENYNIPQVTSDKRYLSTRTQMEYDCKGEQWRSLFFAMYSGAMGNGDTVYSDDSTPDNWKPFHPQTGVETLWKFACGKR